MDHTVYLLLVQHCLILLIQQCLILMQQCLILTYSSRIK